jgi:hypothetical protein
MANEKSYKYDTLTPASDVIRILDRIGACASSQQWYHKYEGKTFGELVSGCLDEEFRPGWAAWFLKVFGADVCPAERKKLLQIIKDPMQSLTLSTSLGFLDDDDRLGLRQKYAGKLPRAENEAGHVSAVHSKGSSDG